jgi:hypothetical protein
MKRGISAKYTKNGYFNRSQIITALVEVTRRLGYDERTSKLTVSGKLMTRIPLPAGDYPDRIVTDHRITG